ncbi:hypothetical protein RND81_12G110000 [Saponaria officinalis]|uniref:Protein SGT1 homolog n=1 Tax=Saponaria officinalis TaxID=3572 RepID=A0AAW1H948_SAPOF
MESHDADVEKMAKEAFIDDHFELAVELYTKAIELIPNHPQLYVERAQSNFKLFNFHEAVADANRAIELDPSMSKAYLRKGTACLKLEEYRTAKAAFQAGAAVAPDDSRFTEFIKQCDAHIAADGCTVADSDETTSDANTAKIASSLNGLTIDVPAARPKFRHEFYQKPEEVVVTVFAKGIPATSVAVDYGEQILSVTIDIPSEEPYRLQSRLFGKIIPTKCRYEVLSSKIEIRLVKAEVTQWTSLEYNKDVTVAQKINVSTPVQRLPSYPSSKHNIDWDRLEAQVKKEEKDEKLEGDAALNKFFRDIYSSADEDMRRAMQKSFVESNGTVLSTNWQEVGTKKVEGTPPDGMEMKKWEY